MAFGDIFRDQPRLSYGIMEKKNGWEMEAALWQDWIDINKWSPESLHSSLEKSHEDLEGFTIQITSVVLGRLSQLAETTFIRQVNLKSLLSVCRSTSTANFKNQMDRRAFIRRTLHFPMKAGDDQGHGSNRVLSLRIDIYPSRSTEYCPKSTHLGMNTMHDMLYNICIRNDGVRSFLLSLYRSSEKLGNSCGNIPTWHKLLRISLKNTRLDDILTTDPLVISKSLVISLRLVHRAGNPNGVVQRWSGHHLNIE
jgi:hypothetical protein